MCVCQHKAIRGFPDRGHSWAYSAPFSCPEKKKAVSSHVQSGKTKETHLEAQVEPVFHLPPFKMYEESIWRHKRSLRCARQQELVLLLCLSFPHVCLKCYFNFSFTQGKTMNNLHLQEKGSGSQDKPFDTN